MPVRNGGAYLEAAVESILAQSLGSLELLLVDDHSDDGAIAALQLRDPRLIRLRSPGRGVSAAFNFGFGQARGPYIARMDADDIALPGRFVRQLEYLEAHPEVDICGGCVEIFADKPVLGGNQRYQAWLNACRSPDEIRRQIFIESPIPNPTVMFRRAALTALGAYGDPEWPEDYDLYLRADVAGMKMGKPEAILLRWREHEQRLTRTSERYATRQFQAAKAHYLAAGRLRGRGSVVIWGAGPGGREMHDLLHAEGVAVEGFLDVHPRRLGGRKRGLPVWPIDHVAALSDRMTLVAVGSAGARPRIRGHLLAHGLREGENFLFVL
jgi:hypothetical protein